MGPVEQQIGDRYYYHQTEKFPPPHQIPSPPKDFTGRQELIDRIVEGFGQGSTIIGLRGMGGLGKTALAYKLAEMLRDRYQDGQLMVDLRGASPDPFVPAGALAKILRYYYPAVALPQNLEELQSLYLSTLDGKCALLLLDNALDDHQVRPLLPPDTCGVIITSRRKFALAGMAAIDLDVLKIEEAVALLLRTAGPHLSKNQPAGKLVWEEMARICGCLPVALKAAGSYLACTPGSSPSRYIKELQDERRRLGLIGGEGVEEDLVAKLSLSYNRLAPDTASVFRLLSIFPADFDAQAEEAVCQDEGHQHLTELVRWSPVEYQSLDAESEGRYHLHELVRLFAAYQLEEKGEEIARNEAQLRHSEYYKNIFSDATELYIRGGDYVLFGLRKFDLERTNIEAGWKWAKRNSKINNAAAYLCNEYLYKPFVLELRMTPIDRISWLETALHAARQLNDRGWEGVHLGNLGLAYRALNKPSEAIKLHEEARAISHESGSLWLEGASILNVGLSYADIGDYNKAIEHYEQALIIANKLGEKRGKGNALGNLGIAYKKLGDAKKAIEYYEQQLKITQEIGDRHGEANACWNLGLVYEEMGDLERAAELMQVCVDFEREIGHPEAEKDAALLEDVRAKLNSRS
jgi:tetratricopeptide (TPR) repeat protein